jgi:Raf kinase inhibitor-like YbhB/YbcL family protein
MQNTSPPLAWTGAPAGAKSFAVVMVDAFFMPPKVHWIIYDLGPAVASLPSGIPAGYVVANPSAHQSLGDFAGNQYLGPCPPQGGGAHEYDITLHALDVDTLPGLGMSSTAATTQAAVLAHSIATSKMTLTFSR